MKKPEPGRILQIISALPSVYGVFRQAGGDLEFCQVSVWALVEIEDGEMNDVYGCFACELGLEYFETARNFLGYAASEEDAAELYKESAAEGSCPDHDHPCSIENPCV